MATKYLKPDYNSENFKTWQTRNPGAPSEWYQPSVSIPHRASPDHQWGLNAENDAQQRFLMNDNPATAGEVIAGGYNAPGHTPLGEGYTPNYNNAPGMLVTQGAVDKGFELMPEYKYDIVNELPAYANNIQSYGKRAETPVQAQPPQPPQPPQGEPSGAINSPLSSGYQMTPPVAQQPQPAMALPSNAGNLVNQNPMTNDWNWQQYLTQFPQQQQQQHQTGTQNQNNSNPYWNSPMMSLY